MPFMVKDSFSKLPSVSNSYNDILLWLMFWHDNFSSIKANKLA
jgi:hypothetical protein